MAKLFRKQAVERLRSPERLDQLLRVTSTRGWIVLMTICFLIVTAVCWGFLGDISTRVDGLGLFIEKGGVNEIVAEGSGRLTSIHVETGDTIKQGQVVASMVNPDIEKKLKTKKLELALFKNEYEQQKDLIEKELESKQRVLKAQKENILNSIKVQHDKVGWIEDRLAAYTELFEKGLVLKRQIVQIRLERDDAILQIAKLQNDLGKIKFQEVALEESKKQQLFKQRFQIDETSGQVQALEIELKEAIEVQSPFQGRVIGIEGDVGTIIERGQPIMTVELAKRELAVLLYVKAFKGKKIQPGMTIQITPSTVKREEFGFIFAKVTDVSDFPVTADGMMRVINNKDLVDSLLKEGPLISVKGDLVRDSATRSGFKWSSHKGASIAVTAGTLGTSEVVVRRQPPIELVIPILKEWTGA